MKTIEKIRQKIEELYEGEAPAHDQQCEFEDGYFTGIAAISKFLDTLEESDKCKGCNNVKGCIACVDGDQWAHYEESEISNDLAMTWEDVKQIVEIADKLCPYTSKNIAEFQQEFQTEESYYKEVLRRFNEAGGGKNL